MKRWAAAAGLAGSALAAWAQGEFKESLRLEVGASSERGAGAPSGPWGQTDATLRWGFAPRANAEITLRRADRFGVVDSEWGLGVAGPVAPLWSAGLSLTRSTNGELLPTTGLRAELAHELGGGWVLGGAWSRRLYKQNASRATSLTVEHYVGAWRIAGTGTLAQLEGVQRDSTAWRLQLDREFEPGHKLGVVAANGSELDADGQGGAVTNRFQAFRVLGRWALTPDWALLGDVGVQRQKGLGGRNGGRVALEHRLR
jgi:YaiO family outer membrane protein